MGLRRKTPSLTISAPRSLPVADLARPPSRDLLSAWSGLEGSGSCAAYVTLDTQERKAVRRATTSLEAESQTGSRPDGSDMAAISGSSASYGVGPDRGGPVSA